MAETAPKRSTKTTSKNNKHFNLLGSMAMSQTPVLVELIERINEDYELGKKDEMVERYIHKDDKVWKRMVKKFKPKNNRSKSGYTIFLSDPVMVEKIKSDNDGIMMKNLNPNKGEIWGKIKTEDKKLYKRYCNVAKLFNHKLIEFDEDKSDLRDLIKVWMYEKELSELEHLLEKIPKPVPKRKKQVKKKVVQVEDSSDEESSDDEEEKEEEKPKPKKKRMMVESDSDDSVSFDFNSTV